MGHKVIIYLNRNSSAQLAKIKWLKTFDENKSIVDQHYIALHSKNNNDITSNFILTENMIPKTVLKKAIENALTSPEEILNVRINFMRNYSVICAAGYILGIGDRHLENFLMNVYGSEVYMIDFGISFGQGLYQLIPELIPFRLTHQIRSVMWPLGVKGCIKQTLVNTLSAFKDSRDDILDCCEIFVKEPLIEWIKVNKLNSSNNDTTNVSNPNSNINFSRNHLLWVPMKKLNVIQNKLLGINPVHQMLEDLMDTRHSNEVILL
jgi:DNA-dependent protein kinase catalytic subunit